MSLAAADPACIHWELEGISIPSASHVANNLPMQDSLRGWPNGLEPADFSILALSDGHGNTTKHFRSDIGAMLATKIALSTILSWMEKFAKTKMTERIFAAATKTISTEVHREWVRQVTLHAKTVPFSKRRLSRLSDKQQKLFMLHPQIAYGATCLCAAMTNSLIKFNDFGILSRIGDGVIACCSEDGTVTLPFNEKEKQNQQTASLCNPNAIELMEFRLLQFEADSAPAFIAVSSDGYPDAVGGVDRFVDRVSVFWEMLRKEGSTGFMKSLKAHLEEDSDKLFDDTSLGFLVRSDWLAK